MPESVIRLRILLNIREKIDRKAFGRTILLAQKYIRDHPHGNDWLSPEDDPYEVDDRKTGRCMIGMQSKDRSGRSNDRMTYRGVYDVFQGLYDVMYFTQQPELTYVGLMEISNHTRVVGLGRMIIGNVPAIVANQQ